MALPDFRDVFRHHRYLEKDSEKLKLKVTCSTIMNKICKYLKTQKLVRTEKCIYSNQRNIFGNAI